MSAAIAAPRSRSASAGANCPSVRRARAEHPERGQARRELRGTQPLERRGRLVDGGAGPGQVGRLRQGERTAGERRGLEDGVADRARVVSGVAGLAARVREVSGHQAR